MSELKAFEVTRKALFGRTCTEKVYFKSEADNVITELKEKLKVQTSITEEAWKLKDVYHTSYAEAVKELYEKNKQIRHQKCKHCLAMAEWCDAEADVADADGDYEDMRWYQKWHERWLELAEKFKEAKS